jgi:UTP--glucose-1-phosphate uridylyltransferase
MLPVAGLDTRMLPVVDRPLIEYIVREAIAAGIKEIILVTHSSKNSIENHFDKSFELDATLEKRVKRQLLAEVQNICPRDVIIMHVRRGKLRGLDHAILCARPLIGDNPFVVLLPDVLIDACYMRPK